MTIQHHYRLRRSKRDTLIVCGLLSAAFALFIAPYFPSISHYDLWPALVKFVALEVMLCVAAFLGGYWVRGRMA